MVDVGTKRIVKKMRWRFEKEQGWCRVSQQQRFGRCPVRSIGHNRQEGTWPRSGVVGDGEERVPEEEEEKSLCGQRKDDRDVGDRP